MDTARIDAAARALLGDRALPGDDDAPAPQPYRPIADAFDFMQRGWRPAASWACVAILLTFGVVAPVTDLFQHRAPHLDLALLGVLIAALKLAHDRRVEKQEGLTS